LYLVGSASELDSFLLQVDVAVLALIGAVATIVPLGDVSKARGLVCSGKARIGIGDGRCARCGILGVS